MTAPSPGDVAWSVLGLLAVGLLATAFVVWSRSRDRSIASLGWFFAMFALPILGPIGYLLDSRRRARLTADEQR